MWLHKTEIKPWTIFWLSEIVEEVFWYKDTKYKRYFKIKCLNCWWEWIKELKDLKKESRPRTCWKCKYYKWESRLLKEWEVRSWYTFIKELEQQNWNRRALVLDLDWNEKNVCYHSFISWILDNWSWPRIIHWMNNTRFYKIYAWILCRCNTSSASHYIHYWWRWIKCEWVSFEEFKNDMYESYLEHSLKFWEKNTTIDRIDVNWNYNKDNCRWCTMAMQLNNTRRNIKIPDKFKWKTLIELCKEYWLPRWDFYHRYRNKWLSFEESLWIKNN
jgi:hypothetical protein